MKTEILVSIGGAFALLAGNMVAAPLGTAITYQGKLDSGINPANGSYDFQFKLFDAPSAGLQTGSTAAISGLGVSNGLFTVSLDFGGVYNGNARWVEIGLRTNGGTTFTTLLPRQELKPAPYALYAPNAGVAATANTATTVGASAVGTSGIQTNAVDSLRITDGTIVAADLSPGLLNGTFWRLGGNAGTTAGANFLGTTDNQPLEFEVHGQRAFRLEPTTNSPNVIGGFAGNFVSNAVGATISGGGADGMTNFINLGSFTYDFIGPNFGTIGGGSGNFIQTGSYATIGGGAANHIDNDDHISHVSYATIGGGASNFIGYVKGSTIAGGVANEIMGDGAGGGWANYATIGGGTGNFIPDKSQYTSGATIAGGGGNAIGKSSYATIGGGSGNSIPAEGTAVTISGGQGNAVQAVSYYSTIGGGQYNTVGMMAAGTVIGGGSANAIYANAKYGTIPGGAQAVVRNYGQMAYASGQFTTNGDAQTSLFVCRGTTTNATQTELFLDGLSQRMMAPTNSTWSFDILITGRASGGKSAGYHILGVVKNSAGTTSLVGSLTKTVLGEDVSAWDATVMADDTNDALAVKVTGAASTSIRWAASVRTSELIY